MPTPDPKTSAVLAAEREANRSTAEQWERFAEHRARLTRLLLDSVSESLTRPSLAVLGAGNVNDLDLDQLVAAFAEIHLFDLDQSALERAHARLAPEARDRVVLREPVDLTDALDKLPRWAAMQVTPEELMGHPRAAVDHVSSAIGMRFDRLVSPCMWTQLHLQVLQALGPRHRLLDAVSYTTSLTHLRLISALLAPAGKALFVTELTSNETADLPDASKPVDHMALLRDCAKRGNAIAVAHPERLSMLVSDDPVLLREVSWSGPIEAWVWQQGPERRYLTYASWLERRPEAR